MKKVFNNPLQFLQTDEAVIVDVKHFEYLFQVVLWSPVGHDVKYNHKFSKIDVTILERNRLILQSSWWVAVMTLLVSYILKM